MRNQISKLRDQKKGFVYEVTFYEVKKEWVRQGTLPWKTFKFEVRVIRWRTDIGEFFLVLVKTRIQRRDLITV